ETKKILIVDDEPGVVSYLEMLLNDNGYETASAANGDEALAKARSDRPDLITLDISMPESSGARFFKELRADSDLGSVPVVVVTAVTGYAGDPYGYLKFMQKQANLPEPEAFFPKPIDKDALLDTIHKLVS
ncbi:MAG: response regulator, partial [Planctomycetota bacterium]